MANRRCIQALTRRASSLLTPNLSLHSLTIPVSLPIQTLEPAVTSNLSNNGSHLDLNQFIHWSQLRHFSSDNRNEDDDEEEDDDDDEDEDDDDVEESSDDESVSGGGVKREYSQEEKEAEAEAIGYKVAGPLDRSDRVFKPYEPVFAVVQIGSHQFKVSNGDCIFTERLKFCEVNEKLILNKVLLLGSSSQTIVGRPIVPDAAVHAVVEEHALDAKVIIFKKKRRKNYRRTKGHRQELTKLRITDIQGIEKPENKTTEKPLKAVGKKQEQAAVAA